MRYGHLNVGRVSIFEETIFSQKWSFLIKYPGKISDQSSSQIIFFLSSFIRRVEQAQKFEFWMPIFEKIYKKTEKFRLFGLFFDLRGRGVAKILFF
jgi:hypothetical protein